MTDPIQRAYDLGDKYGNIRDEDLFHFMFVPAFRKLINEEADNEVILKTIKTLMSVFKIPIDPSKIPDDLFETYHNRVGAIVKNSPEVYAQPYLLPGNAASDKWVEDEELKKIEECARKARIAEKRAEIEKRVNLIKQTLDEIDVLAV